MRLIRLLKNDIAREAAEWVDESIITENQAEAICQRYEVDYQQVNNSSFAYSVLIALAGLFVGLALITILGANWDEIPRGLRMSGLVLLTLATQLFGLRKFLAGDHSAAIGIFFLGNFFYGAAIILIAQIYHLGEHMPDGIFWWGLGCLPFALITRSPLLGLQAIALGLTWFFVESGMGFYPTLFPLFIAASLYILLGGKRSITLLLCTIAGIGLWFEYSLSEFWRDSRHYQFEAEHLAVSVGLFILVYTFSHWLNQKASILAKDYASVLALWSLRFGLILMILLSYEGPWRALISAHWEHQTSVIIISALFSAAALYLAHSANKLIPVGFIVPVYLLSLLMVLSSGDESDALIFQIVYNLALISSGIWLIFKGIRDGISHYFSLGVATILITAFIRYIDLIGDYIGAAVLFMVFAGLLVVAAKYWKRIKDKEAAA